MKKKKNGFLTFCFSCFPGAGQMFLGFPKEGVSLMGLFLGIIAFTSFMQFDAFIYLLPVIWFYAFFDGINKNSMTEEEFMQLEDHFLFVDISDEFQGFPLGKFRNILAVILILLGMNLLLRNIIAIMGQIGVDFPYYVVELILYDDIPRVIAALLIIAAGIHLITGKKRSLNSTTESVPMVLEDSEDNRKENNKWNRVV